VFSDRHAGRSDFCCPRAIFIIDKPCRIGSLCGNRQREVFRLLVGYIRFGRSWTSLGWRPDGSCTQSVGNDRRNGRPVNWSSSYFVCLCYNFGPFVSSGRNGETGPPGRNPVGVRRDPCHRCQPNHADKQNNVSDAMSPHPIQSHDSIPHSLAIETNAA